MSSLLGDVSHQLGFRLTAVEILALTHTHARQTHFTHINSWRFILSNPNPNYNSDLKAAVFILAEDQLTTTYPITQFPSGTWCVLASFSTLFWFCSPQLFWFGLVTSQCSLTSFSEAAAAAAEHQTTDNVFVTSWTSWCWGVGDVRAATFLAFVSANVSFVHWYLGSL